MSVWMWIVIAVLVLAGGAAFQAIGLVLRQRAPRRVATSRREARRQRREEAERILASQRGAPDRDEEPS